MKKNNKVLILLFVLAAGIFLFSSFTATRAALIESAAYNSQFEMFDIGVTLNENGKPLAWRRYDASNEDWEVSADATLFNDIKEFKYGVIYPEVLTVTNSGQIDEYVRVTVYKYWLDETGKKRIDLDLNLIDLGFAENDDWLVDEDYATDERTVLYYALPLAGAKSESGSQTTPAFMETMNIKGSIKDATHVTQTIVEQDPDTGFTVIETVYDYDGKQFCVKVEVHAIQTHNAKDAALSAWGRQVNIDESDGRLSLVKEDKQ